MNRILVRHLCAITTSLSLAACGGGSGGASNAPSSVVVPPVTTTPTPLVSFNNASVHDPAVTKVGSSYYSFGSHLAAAKTTDLMNWTKVADGVTTSNPLFNDVTKALAETFSWSTVVDLWRPYVIQLADGKFYMYYNSCQGSSPLSALGVAVADKIEGPYVNKQIFLKSGGSVAGYNVNTQPNVVDPYLFHDASNKLWMIYGSFSGGIFILSMDESTGLPLPNQGYGKHLMGGNSSRIEGSSVIYSPQTHYYYMLFTFGGLDANGGYNIRAARSVNPDGPYLDAKGNDMNNVKGNFAFDDATIAPFAQKLMGNHQFALASGESGTALGYVSPGGASALYEAASNQYFIVFHTRFPNTGEAHEIRVHEMFLNADGWPVVAPFRYVPLSKSNPTLSNSVSSSEALGSYKMINHGKDISAVIKTSQEIKLNADGTVSGALTGSWLHQGNNQMSITLGSNGTFKGVLSRQWNTNANAFVISFTAQSNEGVSIWGARIGN
ncbi:glycoside hydrolase family 43 protein [Undibacterium sp. Ji22W]|uniref:glycoside hydrolase family 43 protein n=1 Tax=Undibacterium sp. Ji22W TaxID=3413038 RepID=UPI003BF1D6AE